MFNLDDETKDSNIAATLLKISERKTAKGNSYAVLKLTDLTSVFELFIFSDILELNREILVEGNSLILTLAKSITNDENRFKRVNVQKIGSLKDLFNSSINEVFFEVKSVEEVNEISKILDKDGKTSININLINDNKTLTFKLKNNRNLDRKSLNLLRKREISSTII
jgi:DNA polymerase-3 subunit alpha